MTIPTDEYIEAAAQRAGLGAGVLHDLNVSHGASFAALVFGSDRDAAMALIDEWRASLRMEPEVEPYGPALYMPCGYETAIATRDDFPAVTTVAGCGHPEHFLVYYVGASDVPPAGRDRVVRKA